MKNNRVEEFIKNPKKAFFILALPVLITMLVQSLYNLVDTAFVGRLGAEAIAALTFSWPLFFLMIAINAGLGAGMSSRISRYLGEKNKKAAENTALHGLLISFVLGLIILIIGIVFIEQIFVLFGAEGNVLALSISYMSIIFLGFLFMFPSFILSSIFSAQGDTKTPMKVHITTLLLNIVLDPIFIYVLGLGVKGAAIATTISFFVSLILFSIYIGKKSYLKIHLKKFRFSAPITFEIFKVGAPASLMMILMSVYIAVINRFMAHFGTDYVAAFGIGSRLESVALMPMVALGISTLTLIGMFYGAKKYEILKETGWYGLKVISIYSTIMGAIFFAAPKLFLRIFTPNPTLLGLGADYVRIIVFTFPTMAIVMLTTRIMQGMGDGIPGLVINGIRFFIVAVPLAYIFVFVLGYGYLSVAVAMVTGGLISSIIALVWLKVKFKNLEIQNI